MSYDTDLLKKLFDDLPAMISRDKVEHYLGGIISSKYLANLDSKKLGPPRFRIGRKVGYFREDLITWIANRFKTID